MTILLNEFAKSCVLSGRVSEEDVVLLRNTLMEDGVLNRGMAEALFTIERGVSERCPQWRPFFLDAMVDHAVWIERPTGRVTSTDADWLLARTLGDDGMPIGLMRDLLIEIVREAEESDPRLMAAAYGFNRPHPGRAPVTSTLGWLDSAGISA